MELNNITIRLLRKTDAPEVLALLEKTYLHNPNYISHSCRQMGIVPNQPLSDAARKHLQTHVLKHIGGRNQLGFIALTGTRILGYVLIQKHQHRDCEPYGELSDLVVVPRKHSAGVGQMLIARAMAQFRDWKLDHTYLESGITNKAAHRFFAGQGWQTVSQVLMCPTRRTPHSETEVKPESPDVPPSEVVSS